MDRHFVVGVVPSRIVEVMLPNGDPVLVQLKEPEPGRDARRGTEDVGFADTFAQVGVLPGFTETVRGVVASAHQALEHVMPDGISVEFGIEITVRAGKVVSVLADAGGAAHVNVTASWNRSTVSGGQPEETRPA